MSRSLARSVAWMGWVVLALPLPGCVRGCTSSRPPIHMNPNMDWQEKYAAQEASDFFYDGKAMRAPVSGTVARGQLHEDAASYTGKDGAGGFLARSPLTVDQTLLDRGAQRFAIYCQPCHDKRGSGKGILYERGGVPTTSLHDPRLLGVSDGELFDVITHGKGLMPAYGYPILAADRWAIVAHVRRLQQEQQQSAALEAGGTAEGSP